MLWRRSRGVSLPGAFSGRPSTRTWRPALSADAAASQPSALPPVEARYRALFDRTPLPMWVYDVETLAFLEVNEAAVQQYGYGREEFLALTMMDIRPPEQRPALLAVLQRLPPTAKGAGVWTHRRKDGTQFDAQIVNQPLDWDGRAARLAVAEDVSQLRRMQQDALRASESHFRSLVE